MKILVCYKINNHLMLSKPYEWDEEHDTNGKELPEDAKARLYDFAYYMLLETSRIMTKNAGLPWAPHKYEIVAIWRPERPKPLWQSE